MLHNGVLHFAASAVPSLGALPGWTALLAIAIFIILAGLVVLFGRYFLEVRPKGRSMRARDRAASAEVGDPVNSLVRSWIAISLVGGLLIFCAEALSLPDSVLRSTLFGGLVSSTGAAVAFYFSAKSSDKARQDLVNATQTTPAPKLKGKTVKEALTLMAGSPLRLDVDTDESSLGKLIEEQSISEGTLIRNGTVISATVKD